METKSVLIKCPVLKLDLFNCTPKIKIAYFIIYKTTAKRYAEERNIEFKEFPPEYEKYGSPAALFIRNRQIVDACDNLIAFWDGTSRGTKDSLDYAKSLNKPIKIIKYKEIPNKTFDDFLEE